MSTDRVLELARLQLKIESELNKALRDAPRRRRRSRFDIPPCGTETGYQRHRYRGEVCEDCKEAHATHERLRYRQGRKTGDVA